MDKGFFRDNKSIWRQSQIFNIGPAKDKNNTRSLSFFKKMNDFYPSVNDLCCLVCRDPVCCDTPCCGITNYAYFNGVEFDVEWRSGYFDVNNVRITLFSTSGIISGTFEIKDGSNNTVIYSSGSLPAAVPTFTVTPVGGKYYFIMEYKIITAEGLLAVINGIVVYDPATQTIEKRFIDGLTYNQDCVANKATVNYSTTYAPSPIFWFANYTDIPAVLAMVPTATPPEISLTPQPPWFAGFFEDSGIADVDIFNAGTFFANCPKRSYIKTDFTFTCEPISGDHTQTIYVYAVGFNISDTITIDFSYDGGITWVPFATGQPSNFIFGETSPWDILSPPAGIDFLGRITHQSTEPYIFNIHTPICG